MLRLNEQALKALQWTVVPNKWGKGVQCNLRGLYRLLELENEFSIRTFYTVFRKKKATVKTLEAIVGAVQRIIDKNVRIEQFIDFTREETRLPEDESFYTRLKYCRFIASGHDPSGQEVLTCKWWWEVLRLVQIPTPPYYPDGTAVYKGVQVNNLSPGFYSLLAMKVSPFLFTITGYNPNRTFSYQASFTKCFRQEGRSALILSGTWIGIDYAGRSSQFRCLASTRPIEDAMIGKVLQKHAIRYEEDVAGYESQPSAVQFQIDAVILNALQDEPKSPGALELAIRKHCRKTSHIPQLKDTIEKYNDKIKKILG